MNLTNMSQVKELMEEFGISTKKKYGQNFLINENIPIRIADSGIDSSEDGIIEIGPGIGTMTVQLCERAKKVVAFEIDADLIPVLGKTLMEYDNVKVIHGDFLKADVGSIIKEEFAECKNIRVCANLPYYITTPIIMELIEGGYPISSITVMVQNEVADRLCSEAGDEDYGAVTASIAYHGKAVKLFKVGAGSFLPAPKVDSAVVRIDIYEDKPVKVKSEKTLSRVIKGAFAQRRKTLINALSAEFSHIPKDKLSAAIEDAGFSPSIRGEKLDVASFAAIADQISLL